MQISIKLGVFIDKTLFKYENSIKNVKDKIFILLEEIK